MTKTRTARLAILLLAAPPALGVEPAGWRFCDAADGLSETYSRTISSGPNGDIWVRHGAVRFASILNGYSVAQIPEPRLGVDDDFNLLKPISATGSGGGWVGENGNLKEYVNRRWVTRATQAPGERMITALAITSRRVLILFNNRLSTYDPETRSWTVVKTSAATALGEFRNMTSGFSGEVFTTGPHGIARLETLQKSGPYEWVEFDTRRMGVMNLEKAFPDQDGEAFVTGTRISTANTMFLIFRRSRPGSWNSSIQISTWKIAPARFSVRSVFAPARPDLRSPSRLARTFHRSCLETIKDSGRC
jgi:hypothetical protein